MEVYPHTKGEVREAVAMALPVRVVGAADLPTPRCKRHRMCQVACLLVRLEAGGLRAWSCRSTSWAVCCRMVPVIHPPTPQHQHHQHNDLYRLLRGVALVHLPISHLRGVATPHLQGVALVHLPTSPHTCPLHVDTSPLLSQLQLN